MTSNISIRGWEIPVIWTPNIELYLPYELFEDPSHNCAVFLYNIIDIRMMLYVGQIKILLNKNSPTCIDDANFFVYYDQSNTIQWIENSSMFMAKLDYLNDQNITFWPILFIDYKKRCFACIKTTRDYGIEVLGVTNDLIILKKKEWPSAIGCFAITVKFEDLSWNPFPVTNKRIYEFINAAYSI